MLSLKSLMQSFPEDRTHPWEIKHFLKSFTTDCYLLNFKMIPSLKTAARNDKVRHQA